MTTLTHILILFVFATAATAQQTAHYRRSGQALLNDLQATPGATRPGVTEAQLCAKSFHTGSVRDVSESVKHQVCAAYGVGPGVCSVPKGEPSKVEIDHLISLELGGSNDPKNLWPQPYLPKPGAKEKDGLEDHLHALVCAGKVSLKQAQQCIAQNWMECATKYSH
jgi:hypothetical protein